MRVKCIALDLDGTTLDDDKSITAGTRNAIEEAIRRGISVVIASGRCLESLPESVTEIPGIEYAITSNGAAVYKLRSGECLRRVTLPLQAVQGILRITEGIGVIHEVFYRGKPYAFRGYVEDPLSYGAMPYAENYIRTTRHPVEDIRQFIRDRSGELDGIDLVAPDPKTRAWIWEQVERELSGVYVTSSVRNRVEIASAEAGKHQGLAAILGELGISPLETAAFGDADNDVEMLSCVGYGMAVENGTEQCRAAADRIVPSNRREGVAEGIRWLLEL